MFLKKLQEILGNFSGIILSWKALMRQKTKQKSRSGKEEYLFMKETAPERPIFPVSCLMLN